MYQIKTTAGKGFGYDDLLLDYHLFSAVIVMVVICFAKLQFGCGIRPDQPAPDRSHPFGVPATSSNTAAVGGHKRGVGELGNPDFQ